MTENGNQKLTAGKMLARNTVYNIIGQGAPMIVAIFAIPILIKGMGTDRFGVLTLAWMVIGYFSLFDLGMGRALTKLIATSLGAGKEEEIPAQAGTALMLMAVLGVGGAILLVSISPALVHRILKITDGLQAEALKSFYLLAITIPMVIVTIALRGILEAYQRFDLVTILRLPMGVFTFLGPLAVLPFSNKLHHVVGILVVVRLIALVVNLYFCLRFVPALGQGMQVRLATVRPLLNLGGWMTLSNIISPLMVYLDRFLIGWFVSMAAVAYYVTPYEVVTKLWILPGAIVGVMFPAFATTIEQNRDHTAKLVGRSVNYIFLAIFPLTLFIVVLAQEGLMVWVGQEFAQNSTRVTQWLALGVFFNCLARVPFALVQGLGRPDLTAKVHLIESPLYICLLWWLLGSYGTVGAAFAWMVRMALDTVIFFLMGVRLLPELKTTFRRYFPIISMAATVLLIGGFTEGILLKLTFLTGNIFAYLLLAWFLFFEEKERCFLKNHFLRQKLSK